MLVKSEVVFAACFVFLQFLLLFAAVYLNQMFATHQKLELGYGHRFHAATRLF